VGLVKVTGHLPLTINPAHQNAAPKSLILLSTLGENILHLSSENAASRDRDEISGW
tara:strand:- start:1254 stop:1421 length:168 start_codon:yes stop_codon:yes gene_type:complete